MCSNLRNLASKVDKRTYLRESAFAAMFFFFWMQLIYFGQKPNEITIFFFDMLQNQGEEKNWTLMKFLRKQQETRNFKRI